MKKLFAIAALLFSFGVHATNTEFTTGTLDPIDLTGQSGTTSWNLSDDSISGTINLGFNFDFYGETFTSGKGATNGCWTFTGYNNTCQDYTPDPLPQSGMDMTIFPLWGDWIRDSGSKMLYKTFGDTSATDQYFVLGWYNMREYNRSSDNTFEMLLYETTNNIEFRYGPLNITQHDIIIGVQGHAKTTSHAMYNASEYKVYLHHNECSSGTQHDSNDTNCVNTNWNSTSHNTAIENKSLAIVVDDQYGCAANTLLATTCTGYAAAYLTQQCNLDSLYSAACPNYSSALFDSECDDDSQFSPACPGYQTTQSVAYYDDTNYGYDDNTYEDQYGYDEYGYDDTYDEATAYSDDYWVDDDPYWNMEFTDEEWYEIDLQEFGQAQVDEWYGTDVEFTDDGYVNYDDYGYTEESYWTNIDEGMDQYDLEQEQYYQDEYYSTDYYQEEYYQEEYYDYDNSYEQELFVYDDHELLEEFTFQETVLVEDYEDLDTYITFNSISELDQWYEEEIASTSEEEEEFFVDEEFEEEWEENFEEEWEEESFEEQLEEEQYAEEESFEEQLEEELYAEEEVFEEEAVEDIYEDIEEIQEELLALEEENVREDIDDEVSSERSSKRGGITSEQLNVVASTISAATNSVSGTTAGTTATSGGWGGSSGNSSSVSTSGGSSGFSTSSGYSGSSVSTVAGNTTSTAIASSSTGGGFSTSSSPSISDQIQTAQVQTNTLLTLSQDMGSTSGMGGSTQTVSSVTTTITPMPTLGGDFSTPQVVMADVQVQDMQGEIDTAVSGVMTVSEADQIADQIVAANLKTAQEDSQQSVEDTGQYADQSAYVAYLGYNPGFTDYYDRSIDDNPNWYESRQIYANVSLSDNIQGFYQMAGTSLRTLNTMIREQPILDGGTL